MNNEIDQLWMFNHLPLSNAQKEEFLLMLIKEAKQQVSVDSQVPHTVKQLPLIELDNHEQ